MENEENLNLEIDLEDDDTETLEAKPKETDEARLARLDRQASQLRKKLGVEPKKETEKVESKKEEGLDRVDKMLLRQESITDSDEISLVQDFMKSTGKSVEDVIDSRAFKAELKLLRDDKKAEDAIPSNSKRSGQSNSNTVEYWIAKGQMPPANEPKLRQAYVNAKMAKTAERNMFTDNPLG
jgi:hypothetical protein